jgi:serine/threonine-protein kinase
MRSTPTTSDVDTVSLDSDFEIESICKRFEDEWRAGRSPRVEDFCVENPSISSTLLAELITLDLEYRRKHAPSFCPDPAEYHQRFPTQRAAVECGIASFYALCRVPAEDRVGPYKLLEELGRGGQGVVYRACREGLSGAEHTLALKLILPARVASQRDVDDFVREVRAMARLNHRGVLQVFDSGEARGRPFVAMKLVGPSLEKVLRARGTFAPDEAARLVAEVARAVDYLHQHGYIHCDLKPSNILLDGDEPLIADFGLSRILEPGSGDDPMTQVRREGTIPYMAPEQVRGEPSKESDIYSLGAVLFELLTGQVPFGSGRRALDRILREEAPGPRQVVPGVPADLDRIVRKCLRKAPQARYQTAAQLGAELERFCRKEPLIHTAPDTAAQHVHSWTRRHRELTTRLIGLGSILALTQFNHFVLLKDKHPDPILLLKITLVELLWVLASITLDRLSSSEGQRGPLRPVWVATDVGLLTLLLGVLDAVSTELVLSYALLIVVSGLWSRVWLVWLTTALCVAGYAALVIEAYSRGSPFTASTLKHYSLVVLAMMLVTGYVMAIQVARASALTTVHVRRMRSRDDEESLRFRG